MRKIKKYIACFLTLCCIFTIFTINDIYAYSISTNDFKPISNSERVIGHTSIGSWNNGSFFETVTRELVGKDNSTGYENYRFRHYVTHRGGNGSYIYQVTPVGIYLDGEQIAKMSTTKRTSNKTELWGEVTVSIAPGKRLFELKDIGSGAITVVSLRVVMNIPMPSYTVNFVDYNGNLLKSQKVVRNQNATPPPNPSLTGHTFTGWNGSYTNVTNDRTITAQYNTNNYTVNFVDYNGALLKSQSVSYGGSASPPSNPSLAGHTFTGWNGSYTNVSSNRTITASYSINTYTVSFNSNGGSQVPSRRVTYGDKVGKPTNPTKGTDKFIGWYSNQALSNLYNFNSTITSDFTLYAKWDKIPVITADDITIFEDLYSIAEWEIIRRENAKATDSEDGDISRNIRIIEDTTKLSKIGVYRIIYEVTDSANNITKKEIVVNVIDKRPFEDRTKKSIRSISLPYINTLNVSSKWLINTPLNNLLKLSLSRNEETSKERWVIPSDTIEEIKEFNRTHDYSPQSNALFLEQFGHLKAR